MYFDTSYIAKYYVNEPESAKIRHLVQTSGAIHSSFLAFTEFHGVLHRRMREGSISPQGISDLLTLFSSHIEDGLWNFVPVTSALLSRTGKAIIGSPKDLFVRTADAVHLVTAQSIGEQEVWTNDRHLLAAASYFGVTGRSV